MNAFLCKPIALASQEAKNGEAANGSEKATNGGHGDGDSVVEEDDDLICTDDEPAPPPSPRLISTVRLIACTYEDCQRRLLLLVSMSDVSRFFLISFLLA